MVGMGGTGKIMDMVVAACLGRNVMSIRRNLLTITVLKYKKMIDVHSQHKFQSIFD